MALYVSSILRKMEADYLITLKKVFVTISQKCDTAQKPALAFDLKGQFLLMFYKIKFYKFASLKHATKVIMVN